MALHLLTCSYKLTESSHIVMQTNHIHPSWRDHLLSTLSQTSTSYEIWGSHSDNNQDWCSTKRCHLVGYMVPTFENNYLSLTNKHTHTHARVSRPRKPWSYLATHVLSSLWQTRFHVNLYTSTHKTVTLKCKLTTIHCELCDQNLSSTLEMSKSCNTLFIICNIHHQEHQFRLFYDKLIHYGTSCSNLLKHYLLITFPTCTFNIIYGDFKHWFKIYNPTTLYYTHSHSALHCYYI